MVFKDQSKKIRSQFVGPPALAEREENTHHLPLISFSTSFKAGLRLVTVVDWNLTDDSQKLNWMYRSALHVFGWKGKSAREVNGHLAGERSEGQILIEEIVFLLFLPRSTKFVLRVFDAKIGHWRWLLINQPIDCRFKLHVFKKEQTVQKWLTGCTQHVLMRVGIFCLRVGNAMVNFPNCSSMFSAITSECSAGTTEEISMVKIVYTNWCSRSSILESIPNAKARYQNTWTAKPLCCPSQSWTRESVSNWKQEEVWR